MQRVLALVIGVPLIIFLLYVLWNIFLVWKDGLTKKDFVAVSILGQRDKLLADVRKYILDLNSISEKPSYTLHEKFQLLKDAKTIPQIEFATDELADEFTREKEGLDPVVKKFLGR